jgi:adenylosuccinate synthase
MLADVIVDLQYGDCGKGKIASHLCKINDYTHVIRYNGGCNAGHTIYHNGQKLITHHIPCGVLHGIKSIIGPGCVLNVDQFFKEIGELEDAGIDTKGLIKVATNVHIITDFHMAQDKRESEIGTTKRGNGPAYRDKYDRKGMIALEIPDLSEYIIDMYQELHNNEEYDEVKVLFEGAQGFGLDIDWGDYPYVTSSHCTVGGAILNGVPPQAIRDVWGVCKIYETYVGAKEFQGVDPELEDIRELGDEYGATTGRPRQVNWLDLDLLEKASKINGVTKLVMNKVDILDEIQYWKLFEGINAMEFSEKEFMLGYIEKFFQNVNPDLEVLFSGNKEAI